MVNSFARMPQNFSLKWWFNSTRILRFTSLLSALAVMLFTVTNLKAQPHKLRSDIKINVKADTAKMRFYDLDVIEENKYIKKVVLKMRYGSWIVMNPKDAEVLNNTGINVISIELVYTNFHKHRVQHQLNQERLTELYLLAPDIFSQPAQWTFAEQSGYNTEFGARKMFHGIVIKYVEVPIYAPPTKKSMFGALSKTPADTSLYPVFEKRINFDRQLICADLTGSMSPYYIQVFSWLYLKKSFNPLSFSFFNDGDATPDGLKIMGKVGGIYQCRTNSLDVITKYAFNCISGGSGGDSPENNIESILSGLEKYPDATEIIMLADNWSNMRDYSMLEQVDLPVRVIVCGTGLFGVQKPVNVQYLDLARKTGGSLHTIEEELMDLAEMREGEEITVGGVRYVVRGGNFVKR